MAAETDQNVREAHPAERAQAVLASLLSGKKVFLTDSSTGGPHRDPQLWGWSERNGLLETHPNAQKIGWVVPEHSSSALLPEATTRAVNEFLSHLNEAAFTVKEPGQTLQQEGWLTGTSSDRLSKSFRAEDHVVKVWILKVDSIYPCSEEESPP